MPAARNKHIFNIEGREVAVSNLENKAKQDFASSQTIRRRPASSWHFGTAARLITRGHVITDRTIGRIDAVWHAPLSDDSQT